jgi:hypothetical protein
VGGAREAFRNAVRLICSGLVAVLVRARVVQRYIHQSKNKFNLCTLYDFHLVANSSALFSYYH